MCFWGHFAADSFQVIGVLQQLNDGPGSLTTGRLVAGDHQAENRFIADFRWIVV